MTTGRLPTTTASPARQCGFSSARRGDLLSASDQTQHHDQADDQVTLLRVLGILDPRSAGILLRRCGFAGAEPATLDEIGQHFGVTRERIRQLEKAALARLRTPRVRAFLHESDVMW